MKPQTQAAGPQEIELKLLLPDLGDVALLALLSQAAPLAGRKPAREQLHSIYFDTPGLDLLRQRVALRLRQVAGGGGASRWVQTLKTAGRPGAALSERGEWEWPAAGAAPEAAPLWASIWPRIDPDGTLLAQLQPCFDTRFERTSWQVAPAPGCAVEVALDLGRITAGPRSERLCELELELKAGQPAQLFELAEQIAQTVPVLPGTRSKAERAYALCQGDAGPARRGGAPLLAARLPVRQAALQVLSAAFAQFADNLGILALSDDPEVVHQARVGWRRWRSALRLFSPVLPEAAPPGSAALKPLLAALGELRDLDATLTDTLPCWAEAFAAGDAGRAAAWSEADAALRAAAQAQRQAVRDLLRTPATGQALLQLARWVDGLGRASLVVRSRARRRVPLGAWATGRLQRVRRRLKGALREAATPEQLHRQRILAKRLRYGTEALRDVLPPRKARRWQQQAIALQTSLGAARDLQRAVEQLSRQGGDPGVIEFLRGVVAAG